MDLLNFPSSAILMIINFYRIQEEEWDKYIIPAKSESEKYKVSRTFSFLMNRMTSPRNKSKVTKVPVPTAHRRFSFLVTGLVYTFLFISVI